MSKINTDEIRKIATLISRTPKARPKTDDEVYLLSALFNALNEIDRLEKDLLECKLIVIDVAEGRRHIPERTKAIERRTKEACFKSGWSFIEANFGTGTRRVCGKNKKAFKRAIDEAGGDSIDISRQAQLKAEELSRGGP